MQAPQLAEFRTLKDGHNGPYFHTRVPHAVKIFTWTLAQILHFASPHVGTTIARTNVITTFLLSCSYPEINFTQTFTVTTIADAEFSDPPSVIIFYLQVIF
jgi:hypothetical protein